MLFVMLKHSIGPSKLNHINKVVESVFKNCNSLFGKGKGKFCLWEEAAWLIEPEKYQLQGLRNDYEKLFNRPSLKNKHLKR